MTAKTLLDHFFRARRLLSLSEIRSERIDDVIR
jgi:hypothetical protein